MTQPRQLEQVHDIGKRRAWVIWTVSLAVYVLAVFHRSSLGVAGLIAADRFDISATSLAAFTVLQLVVYAAMQVPVGVLLDRFGSRAMLVWGLVLMTAGQLAFAFSESFAAAVAARASRPLPRCTGTCPSEEKNQRDSDPFTPVPVKYSAFARNDTRRGTTMGITTLSMKLRWFAARMTGPSVGMFSRPSTTGR